MYELRVYKKAQRGIKKISRLYQRALLEALAEIQENPLSGKPLTRELTGRYSYKVGDYRVVYKINKKDQIIQVITAGHRSTVYR